MNRKQRRATEKKEKSQSPEEKALAQKFFLFDQLPDECNTCASPFDKTSKTQALNWQVVVHTEIEKVRLFCPACMTSAKKAE
tara:strand:+ start:1172 stop:1417 length:246 start_codon:yes stop_codon:yes gene_type:complete